MIMGASYAKVPEVDAGYAKPGAGRAGTSCSHPVETLLQY
jgi:hypothetical protein